MAQPPLSQKSAVYRIGRLTRFHGKSWSFQRAPRRSVISLASRP